MKKLKEELIYQNDELVESTIYVSGIKSAKYTIKNGVYNGPFIMWFDNNEVFKSGTFKDN